MDRAAATVAFRAFNRWFTDVIGVLEEDLVRSSYSLTEARAIYEVGSGNARTATDLEGLLSIDKGYLSRVISRLEDRGILERSEHPGDRRTRSIALTEAGQAAWATLQARTNEQIGRLLAPLTDQDLNRLTKAMDVIRTLLDSTADRSGPVIRPYRSGDLGWIVSRHGAVYAAEYGWNAEFEALVAEIVAGFVRQFVPGMEQCWIAELEGERVGSIMCVRVDDATAKLRLLLVESSARGHGVGRALVETCIQFAKDAGYREMVLWTNDVLVEARGIYEKRGFIRTGTEPHHSFGQDLVSETWSLDLTAQPV